MALTPGLILTVRTYLLMPVAGVALIHSNEFNRRLSSSFANAGLMTFGGIVVS